MIAPKTNVSFWSKVVWQQKQEHMFLAPERYVSSVKSDYKWHCCEGLKAFMFRNQLFNAKAIGLLFLMKKNMTHAVSREMLAAPHVFIKLV